jgi:hypothetical protein
MPRQHKPRCAVHEAMEQGMSYEDAMEAFQRRDDAALAKYGWSAHLVFDDGDSPTGWNMHTHGLRDNYDHPDFQIILPLTPEVAHDILTNLADAVKASRRFAAGDTASGIIHGFDLGFADATEGGRPVLRVIVPDPEGRTARGEIEEAYAVQYVGTR